MSQTPQQNEILIVEDDEHIAQLLVFIFQREGFKITYAADGNAAEQLIEKNDPPPALIVLDVMLPYQDGFHLLRKIRAQPKWEHLPIIMLTSKSQEIDIVTALNAGASDYILKPFQPGELMARVRRLLKVTS